jgi:phospholipid transport system substrate-binding protein
MPLRNTFKTIAIMVALIFWTNFAWAKNQNLTPGQTVKELMGSIQHIKKSDGLTPQQIETNQVSSQKALALMDLEKVSQKTLGKYWKKRTLEEQKSFISLLSEIFVNIAFPSSAQFFANLKIKFLDSEIEENKASVPISVTSPDDGEVDIDFTLQANKGVWQITDVILDGVSMRNNLRSQFRKVIKSKGYLELVKRMKKKVGEG